MIRARQKPDSILKNQKIQRQLAFSARTPPRTGPRLGAVLGLQRRNQYIALRKDANFSATYPDSAAPTYLPRSCGGARSATTLMARAIVPVLSVNADSNV